MNLNVWQAEAVAAAMRQREDATGRTDLEHAYADIEVIELDDDDQNTAIVKIHWEDGHRMVLGDNFRSQYTDQTERYAYDLIHGWEEVQ